MLSEAGGTVFIKYSKIYTKKLSRFKIGKSPTLTHFIAFKEFVMADSL